MADSNSSSGGIGLLSALGLLFVGLKLGGVITWSWWWVTLPFWGGLAIAAVLLIVALVAALIKALIESR